ncbi:MAG TPA: GAF domain-containing sensor histidine kinase, partial [Polyangia bacterium]|nr:GAF domain-containing sensor histidine kinase [Polyangia bacterium]
AMEIARLRQFEAREHIRLDFLAKTGPLLAESIDYETTLKAIARLVVPAVADLSAIDLLEESGAVKKVVIYHHDHAKRELLGRLLGTTRPERLPEGLRAAIETGRPQRRSVTPEFLRESVSDPEYRELLGKIGATCTVLAPLILRGRVVGVLRLAMAESGRKYTDDDLPLAQEIAHHAALAIEGARLYGLAQSAIVARDNVIAVVSHDLRNYLSTVRMSAELLSRTIPAGEGRAGRKQVDAIERAATRMDQLIGGLRDATMIETGHFTIEPKAEDVRAMVDEAVAILEPQTESRSLQLKVQLEEAPAPVHCDRERVLEVITNLVGNAIKFTKDGGEIRIAEKTEGAVVCFSVSDTGSGIPDRVVPHLFDRYWKGREGNRKGTGMGLFIAKGIVEAHQGRIWVESTVGRGTTFYFTLPVASATGQPPPLMAEVTPRPPSAVPS